MPQPKTLNSMRKNRALKSSIKSASFALIALGLCAVDLVASKIWLTTRFKATQITSADYPMVYWGFIIFYLVFFVLFARLSIKDWRLAASEI